MPKINKVLLNLIIEYMLTMQKQLAEYSENEIIGLGLTDYPLTHKDISSLITKLYELNGVNKNG